MNEPWRDAGLEAAGRAFDLGELSPAARRVLALALDGRSVKEMTGTLVVSEATIRSHLSRIYAKLGVRGRVELLARVAEAGSSRGEPAGPIGIGGGAAAAPLRQESIAPILVGIAAVVVASLLVPFVAPVTILGLLIVGSLALRAPAGTRERRAAPWLFLASLVIGAWFAVLLTGFVAVSSGPEGEYFPGPS